MELAAHWHRCQNLPQKTSDYSTSIQGERGSCQGWVGEGAGLLQSSPQPINWLAEPKRDRTDKQNGVGHGEDWFRPGERKGRVLCC
jgi:hypothetical protein